jgi:hypothetical protein
MSTDQINDHPDGNVVPLHAQDAGTDTRVTEAADPAYTDLSDGRAQRKPVIAEHWQSWERAREHVKLAAARYATPPPNTGSGRPPIWC